MAWYNAAWTKRKKITIDHTKVGSGGVSNFPVLVSLDSGITTGMRSDAADLVFTAADGTTQLAHDLERNYTVIGNGNRFGHDNWPSAIRVGDYTYVGYITNVVGTVGVLQYNHTTGATVDKILHYALGIDDHATPAFLLMPSGKLAAFYAEHNGTAWVSYQTTVGNNTAWTEYELTSLDHADSTGWSYSRPALLADGTIYLFWRALVPGPTNFRAMFSTTTEAGLVSGLGGWAASQEFLTNPGHRLYLRVIPSGNDLHFHISDRNAGDYLPNQHYARFTAGTFYKADGTAVGTGIGTAVTLLEKIWDQTTDGNAFYGSVTPAFMSDIALDASGYPCLTHVVYPDAVAVNWMDHRCRSCRWNGSAWVRTEIGNAGTTWIPSNSSYTAHSSINQADPNEVYWGSGDGTNYQINRAITTDGGATWTSTVVRATTGINIFPSVTLGHGGDSDPLKLLWVNAQTYTSFSVWTARIVAHKPVESVTLAHVKVPTLSSSVDTEIYAYYGNATAADQNNRAGTWSDYGLACRMQRSGLSDRSLANSAAGTFVIKSQTNNANGHLGPLTASVSKIGGAQAYSSGQQSMNMGAVVNLQAQPGLTMSAWVRASTGVTGGIILSSFSSLTSGSYAWCRINTSKLEARVRLADGSDLLKLFDFAPALSFPNTWYHIVVVYDSTNGGLRAWANGQEATSASASTQALFNAATGVWHIGSSPNGSSAMVGTIDEARVRASAVPAAWALTEYNSQNSPSTFYALASEESAPVSSARRRVLRRCLL